jgi:diaminohydroxyphosphoribosylaminopyrimidine deaminase/5-amino-6-(5-phosphoribosylamino)uracil reductase
MENSQTLQDTEWMLRAIALGMKARRISPPNPWVGCVLVRDGNVVGEGFTQPVGSPHAEIIALRAAGESSRGATAYVSLEPCCHHGRTPPCTLALIQAGIARAVVSIEDPDPRVRGRGVSELRAAGIEVTVGICQDATRQALQAYLYHRTTGRPWCIVKAALSLDGRLAAKDGSSHWISGEEARADAHQLRADSQAILIGAGTALRDKPALTVRYGVDIGTRPPLRVLIDARGRVPAEGPLFNAQLAQTLIFTSQQAPAPRVDEWQAAGAEVIAQSLQEIDLAQMLHTLGQRGVLQLLVEGGSHVYSRLFKSQLVNQLTVYYGPLLLGNEGIPFLQGDSPATIDIAPRYRRLHSQCLGDTCRCDYAL